MKDKNKIEPNYKSKKGGKSLGSTMTGASLLFIGTITISQETGYISNLDNTNKPPILR